MSNYTISLCTGFLTRALGLVSTVVLTRLLSLDVLGLLTLVQTCGQTASSLFRLGSNYSYTVLLPTRTASRSCVFLALSYSRLGTLLSVPFSLVVAVYTAGSIWNGNYTYISDILSMPTLLVLLVCIVLAECISELLWSIIFPLKGMMNFVLYRDPFVALAKLLMPLAFYSIWGVVGIFLSIMFINLFSLLGAMYVGGWLSRDIFYSSMLLARVSDMMELTRFGFAGYVFPLITNLIMLPLLLESASLGEVGEIGALRIGAWGSQIITVVGASIAPVLLVNNSRQVAQENSKTKITHLCATIYSIFFALACMTVGYINATVFLGKNGGYEQLQLIVVGGAVIQSLVQLLLQSPLRPMQQLRVNASLCTSLLAGFLFIRLLNPDNILISYALVPFITNIIFVAILFLFRSIRHDLAIDGKTVAYLVYLCLSLPINLAFRETPAFALSTSAVGFMILMRIYWNSKEASLLR